MLMSVSDAEIMRAQKLLAEHEGIFCDPASATALAALLQLRKIKKLPTRDPIILVITGSGLKTLDDVDSSKLDYHEASVETLEKKVARVLS